MSRITSYFRRGRHHHGRSSRPSAAEIIGRLYAETMSYGRHAALVA